MNKFERQKLARGEKEGLSGLGLAQLDVTFSEAEFWREGYKESANDFLRLLASLGATPEEAEEFYLELAAIDSDSGYHFGMLPAMTEILGQLDGDGLVMDESIRRLVLDTLVTDQEGYLVWNNSRKKRVIRTIRGLIKAQETATNLSSDLTCLRLVEAMRGVCGRVGIDARSNLVSVRRGEVEVSVPVDFFCSQVKTEYFNEAVVEFVRVGEFFFIDNRHRKRVSKEILDGARGRIIFVPEINDTEFGGNLGYYTCNTLASLMTADLSGLTILDCGSGSGILSMAALRLGAARVLGVEFDQTRVIKAHKLSVSNSTSERKNLTFLKADLREQKEVIARLAKYCKGSRIGIVSNLGYWPDYPITNITNLAYIAALREAGLTPSLFIAGGHSDKKTRVYQGEAELLAQIGIDWHGLPRKDVEADREILRRLGFSESGFSVSESPMRSSFHAGSVVATV